MNDRVPEAVIRRLPSYYRQLREMETAGIAKVSSKQLAEKMRVTPSQIRQDINCFGTFGRQGVGYKVSDLKGHIAEILGVDASHHMVIVGSGNIGTAIACYPTFQRDGFVTVAMFDNDPARVGASVGDLKVRHVDEMESFIRNNRVDIGVICVPPANAQEVLDQLISCGIHAIWNFAPVDLSRDRNTILVNTHMSESLQVLSYKLTHQDFR